VKKYFFLLFILLTHCKIALLENRTEVPYVSKAVYHQEIGGLQNTPAQYVFEIVFSKSFSEDFEVINFEVNSIPQKMTVHESGKITFIDKTSHFKQDSIFQYKTRIYYKMKTYDLDGIFKKKQNMYRP
jgi:hypothetical protein